MPYVSIIMPQLGESIAEANIIAFLVKPGDNVVADQNLIEVETNKATMTVSSPCNGKIGKFSAELNESCAVGATLGYIEATNEEAARLGLDIVPTLCIVHRSCSTVKPVPKFVAWIVKL